MAIPRAIPKPDIRQNRRSNANGEAANEIISANVPCCWALWLGRLQFSAVTARCFCALRYALYRRQDHPHYANTEFRAMRNARTGLKIMAD